MSLYKSRRSKFPTTLTFNFVNCTTPILEYLLCEWQRHYCFQRAQILQLILGKPMSKQKPNKYHGKAIETQLIT